MSRVRLTKARLQIIVDALAFYQTTIDDAEGHLWETDAEFRRLQHDREQAFIWAHQQLAQRNDG